jgi:hypothetical protein
MSKQEKLEFAKSRFQLYKKKLSKKGVIEDRGGSEMLVVTEPSQEMNPLVAPSAGPELTKKRIPIPETMLERKKSIESPNAEQVQVTNPVARPKTPDQNLIPTAKAPSRTISPTPSHLPRRAQSPDPAQVKSTLAAESGRSTSPITTSTENSSTRFVESKSKSSHLNASTSPIRAIESISRSTSPQRAAHIEKKNAETTTTPISFVPVSVMVQPNVRDIATSPQKRELHLSSSVASNTDYVPKYHQTQCIDSSCQALVEVDHQISQTEEITKYHPVEVDTQTDEDKQIGSLTTRLLLMEQEKQQLMQQLQQAMQLHTQMDLLRKDNQNLKVELEKERKIVVLLSAEVDALPDMIEKYHQERMLLRKSAPVESLKEIVVPCSQCQKQPIITL